MENEILGTYAQVHPLSNDPSKRQGQLGMITYADYQKDDIYVAFEHGQQSLYSSDSLMVMRKSNEIFRDIISKVSELSTPDFKTLLEISLKMQSTNPVDHKTALELSLTSDVTRKISQVSLQEKLGIDNSQQFEHEPAHSLGR